MEGWNLIWTPPHFCSGRIPKSFATCHIPSDNVGQHATHQCDVMHFASLLVLVLDFDYFGSLCLCVCVSVMRGCLAGEGGS